MPKKIKVTVTFSIDPSEYSEDLTNSDTVKELVNDMLDGDADIPEYGKREIYLEYLEYLE